MNDKTLHSQNEEATFPGDLTHTLQSASHSFTQSKDSPVFVTKYKFIILIITYLYYFIYLFIYHIFLIHYSCVLIYVGILRNMIVFICISYQSSIVLAFYLFIIILSKLGRITVKCPRTIIWISYDIRNILLLLLFVDSPPRSVRGSSLSWPSGTRRRSTATHTRLGG